MATFVATLFEQRLVTVRFLRSSGVAFRRPDPPHCQNFRGEFCHRRSNWALLTLETVMAYMMFLWDYILTFGMEVDVIWKSKWNFMKGLYLFQRYLPFTDLNWLVLERQSDMFPVFLFSFFIGQMGGVLTEDECRKVYYSHGGS